MEVVRSLRELAMKGQMQAANAAGLRLPKLHKALCKFLAAAMAGMAATPHGRELMAAATALVFTDLRVGRATE
jgi:hypothetical protein